MAISSRIGPYRVLRLINEGGQGGVYLGYDDRLHRRVAIKVYRLPHETAMRKLLLREARLIAGIQSPKVVQVFDMVVAQENIALIMEYVPGCDLEEFLTHHSRPSVATALAVTTDLAGALTAARQCRIVHGDVKARNVLVTESGRVKLTDFGIARVDTEETPGSGGVASISCLSPEQYLGQPLDVRSDLFALGCLLYRMLTGEHPFLRDGQLEPRRLLEEAPRPVESLAHELPPGLSELVVALLQKNPGDRPNGTRQVRMALRSIARTIPLSVSSTLLQEAKPLFREESSRDVPPEIPRDLLRGGHSSMRPFRFTELWSWRNLSWRSKLLRTASSAAVALFTMGVMVLYLLPGETRIHIEMPQVKMRAGGTLPIEVTPAWLVEQVKSGASASLGVLHVTGPIGASQPGVLYAGQSPQRPDETLSIMLRCRDDWCLFGLDREVRGLTDSRQAVLFADMPGLQWAHTIRQLTQELYD